MLWYRGKDMFLKISRYRTLPDIVTTDAKSRTLESKALRLLPEVSGEFLHTVEEVDRLDHLAYKYYKQPQKWWRICDANPEYMSPQSLLGNDSIKTTLFPVVWEGSLPPWSDLLNSVSEMIGIENVTVGTPNVPFADIQIFDGPLLFNIDVGLKTDLDTAVRTQEFSTPLRQALEDNGLTFIHGASFFFVAKNEWRISELMTMQYYNFKLEEGTLNVYESLVRYSWLLMIAHNEMTASSQAVANQISTFGFNIGQPQPMGRVGKQIVIPPNTVR